jgi:hypothetical protein
MAYTAVELAAKRKALAEPFQKDEIELLPRYVGPTKEVNGRKVPANPKQDCKECGGYHPQPSIHLSYVGHAGITIRLNEVDPDWTWEPMGYDQQGRPAMSPEGLWIWLTVLGKRIPAFGDAQGKTGPNAIKEIIGDAIRNGAMRFGVGTYLWSKSESAKATLVRGIVGDDADEESTEPAYLAYMDAAKALLDTAKKNGTTKALTAQLGQTSQKGIAAELAVMTDTERASVAAIARGVVEEVDTA